MSNSVASESNEGHETPKTSSKRGGEDEGEEDGDEIIEGAAEVLTTSTTVSATPAAIDQFMHTPEFKRNFLEFVPVDALMALRLATKAWKAAADAFIDEGVESSAIIGVKSIGYCAFYHCRSLTTVSFPTTLTSIGKWAFAFCESLDNVDLLQTNLQELGIEAFISCSELKSMTIPDSLQTLGIRVFDNAPS
ncbi:hypothetical protein TrLO_g14595 [Triparma laevis f. longispina]|uniref:Uncharacterized protein n=1 Tax=Triparma laevis f. longispina TaxID=1714387 RepID=A0A9W7E182_9STRA|nr:hypothetical protein TrLO_g14595 [Triparma laevis f. longispina]